jgi:hypothetical protein
MRKLILPPKKILLPNSDRLVNKTVLGIYYNLFANGNGDYVPPVIVVNSAINDEERKRQLEERLKSLRDWAKNPQHKEQAYDAISRITKLRERFTDILAKTPYYLIDGEYKAVAATLTHTPITALELRVDEDMVEFHDMIESGKLFEYKQTKETLGNIMQKFEEYFLGDSNSMGYSGIEDAKSVKQKVDELVRTAKVPVCMRKQYLFRE